MGLKEGMASGIRPSKNGTLGPSVRRPHCNSRAPRRPLARCSLYGLGFVDGAAMPDRENENDEFCLPHLVKNAPIPNPIGPPVAEKTRETLPEFRVLGQTSYRFSNPFLDRTIKLPDFLSSPPYKGPGKSFEDIFVLDKAEPTILLSLQEDNSFLSASTLV